MATKKTSPRVAKIASKALRGRTLTKKESKALGGSGFGQREKGKGRKGK